MQDDDAPLEYKYGTYRFEYVWEALIDRVYGIKKKAAYFPRTAWNVNGKSHDNASLEPDTIKMCIRDRYDGIAVKLLEASNTLDEGRTTNQTHIAITGEQMDIFP